MGYLVTIKYHPQKDGHEFKFDQEVEEEKKIRVGKKDEEVSHSDLAIILLKQLSRRDIYIFDVDVIEYVQKHLNIKNSKNGIIIGNKKYSLDNGSVTDVEVKEVEEKAKKETDSPDSIKKIAKEVAKLLNGQNIKTSPPPPGPNRNNQKTAAPKAPGNRQVIRSEYFNPEPAYEGLSDQFRNLGLTIGKKYDIVNEIKSGGVPDKYTVINDNGGIIQVPITHFTATPAIKDSTGNGDIQLSFPGEIRDRPLDLR